jgi:hypothetical protein
MNTASEEPELQWVICGAHYDNYVVLLASKDLDHSQLEQEIRHPDILWPFDRQEPTQVRYRITAETRKFVIVKAPSYPEALKKLLTAWSPEPDHKLQIE